MVLPQTYLETRLPKKLGAPTWRYRVGEWRLFYEVDDEQVITFMIAVDHRCQAYRFTQLRECAEGQFFIRKGSIEKEQK
jgi:hypothetical protein